nr:hypothetical protein [Brevundimonas subvibrioides]
MSIQNAIENAVSEFRADRSIYAITNLFYEEGADDAAQIIHDAFKDEIPEIDPAEKISLVRFFVKNGIIVDPTKDIREILNAVRSDATALCDLASLASSTGYPEDAKNKPDLPNLRDEIVSTAEEAIGDIYDAKQLVELMAGKYSGLHLNDVAWAESFIGRIEQKFSPKEIKMLRKTLSDVS